VKEQTLIGVNSENSSQTSKRPCSCQLWF